MTEMQVPAHEHTDAGPSLKTYLIVFGILSVCTLLSFVVNALFENQSPHTSMAIIMLIAVVKAVCVAAIFMHLKFEWGKLYFLVIPVVILGIMMMVVLLPDIVIDWHQGIEAGSSGESLIPRH